MARTSTTNKDTIVEAAFKICSRDGIGSLTVRSIASELGTSTAPIYTHFDNMDSITRSLTDHIYSLVLAYTQEQRKLDPFLNIGAGIIAFTLDYTLVFKDFFIIKGHNLIVDDHNRDEHLKQMKTNPFLSLLGDERLTSLLDDMSIYTMGLTLSICSSQKPESLDYYINKLEQTGSKLINYHLISSGQLENYMELFIQKINKQVNIREVLFNEEISD